MHCTTCRCRQNTMWRRGHLKRHFTAPLDIGVNDSHRALHTTKLAGRLPQASQQATCAHRRTPSWSGAGQACAPVCVCGRARGHLETLSSAVSWILRTWGQWQVGRISCVILRFCCRDSKLSSVNMVQTAAQISLISMMLG